MHKFYLCVILISLGYCLGGQAALAADPSYLSPATDSLSASTSGSDMSSSASSSIQPAPAEAGETPKFYTITAELRETYDDNIFTSSTDKVSSWETAVTPSILFSFPMENSQFDVRLTLGATYYENQPGDPFEYTADFVARFTHQFSDRFAIDVRDETGYFTEPGLFSGVGTLYRNGNYVSQNFSTDFTAQWTPLVSSVTSLSNTDVYYDDSVIATAQDSVQNSLSQSIGFAILPKYTLVFAGLYSGITYDDVVRGYNSYTGMTGVDWAVLPSMKASLRVGASYTEAYDAGDATSPYGSASLAWQLGQRSHLNIGYSYSVVPTDVTTASGQLASRVYGNFSYDITRSLSTHLNVAMTHGDYTNALIQTGTTASFEEWDAAMDVGLTYHLSNNFDTDCGYTFSGVSSQLGFRDYTRNQFYVGIRGIY